MIDPFAGSGSGLIACELLERRFFGIEIVADDTNGATDVFWTDRQTGQTVRASVSDSGAQGDMDSYNAGISEDGQWVVFGSVASNFPPSGDTNGPDNGDVFVRGPFG